VKKNGRPEQNELVVCKITNINPNSAFAKLIEYEDLTGMIHVSEVANRWVRNIREFLKENQYVVCKIMRIDGNHISLSAKRVSPDQAIRRMNEYKREVKAEKLLEMFSKNSNINFDTIEEEVIFPLQESFGSLSKAFDIAFKNEELFRKRSDLSKKWADAIIDLIKKNYSEKIYTLKSELKLVSYSPDGVDVIKKALVKAKKNGFDVKYISAPKYIISKSGKNFKDIHSVLLSESERIVKDIQKGGGDASFDIENKARK